VVSTRKRNASAEPGVSGPREVEPAVLEGGLKAGLELAAKNAPGHREGKKEPA